MEINTRCSVASTVPLQTTMRNRTVRSWDIKRRYERMAVKVLLLYHTFETGQSNHEPGVGDHQEDNYSIQSIDYE